MSAPSGWYSIPCSQCGRRATVLIQYLWSLLWMCDECARSPRGRR